MWFFAFPSSAPPWKRIEVMAIIFPERRRWGWVFHESERWLCVGWMEIHLPIFERF